MFRASYEGKLGGGSVAQTVVEQEQDNKAQLRIWIVLNESQQTEDLRVEHAIKS
jgi:hypothetical protein